MEVAFRLCLPREEVTVPVVRHMCRNALNGLGVADDCVQDICVALTEACANVLHHSGRGDEYLVEVEIGDHECLVRVTDSGGGFDFGSKRAEVEATAERGRGIALMRAVTDVVRFEARADDGTVVHLKKTLEFDDRALMSRILGDGLRAAPSSEKHA